MREGWEYKKLGEVTLYPTNRVAIQNLSPNLYVGVENLVKDRGGVSFSEQLPNAESAIEYINDDILIGNIRPYLKKIWLSNQKGGASGDVIVVRIKDEFVDLLSSAFLYKVLSSDNFFDYDNHNTKGAKMPRGDKKGIAQYLIPLPPKSVQLEIVSELDQINELIRLKKELLKDYDNLAPSIFYEMFGDPVENGKGWKVKKLGDIAAFKNGLNFGKAEKGITYKFLGVSDFQDNTFVCSDRLGTIELSQPLSEEYLLEEGDIVFVRSNGSKELVGRNVLMHISEPTTYSGFCIRCRLKVEGWDPVFLSFLLKTPSMRPLITNSGRGCNISNLNQKILGALPVIDVSFEKQQEFSSLISRIERLKAGVSNAIADLETLLASRMQYWFE